MKRMWFKSSSICLLVTSLVLAGCDGDDGDDGARGPAGPAGGEAIDAGLVSDEFLGELIVVSEILDVDIQSPPRVRFTLETDTGVPIIGIVPFWEESNRYIRFTLTKLVDGMFGDPNSWVSYTRDEMTGEPDYDTGSDVIDHGDGSYTFIFATDVTDVPGVPYEPGLTHRLGGQLGSSSVSLEAQNFVYDWVPAGGAVLDTRDIATMDSCNECHTDLVFHGRRFRAEYCVTCHNPDLSGGEGDMGYMIHRIHNGGDFDTLDGGISYAEVTYPQDVRNCQKCHDGSDAATVDGDNWMNVPNMTACDACHDVFSTGTHSGGEQMNNSACTVCHPANVIVEDHTLPNATPNNPDLLAGQRNITYELIDASVAMGGDVTVNLRILSDGMPLDVGNLPADLAGPGRYPGLLLAWALAQDGIDDPQDYNNRGQRAGQPLSLSLEGFVAGGLTGTQSYDGGTGINTFIVTDPGSQYPLLATLRAVGLQGYFQQDIMGEIVSLHTPSAVVAITGDDERRLIVDSEKCASCHEWFEGHGGNRTYNIQICTLCHVPNLSTTGRTVTDPTARDLDDDLLAAVLAGTLDPSVDPNDPLTYPEDTNNLKDMIHGIHAASFRSRPFQHVRGPSRQGYYDWSHITFPRGASTSNCELCHTEGSYELPLPDDVLATTVRTTSEPDGLDPLVPLAEAAFTLVPNDTDWVNSPTASTCFACHTSVEAMAHMELNGGLLSDPSVPIGSYWSNRIEIESSIESCSVCHGPGKSADVEAVHDR